MFDGSARIVVLNQRYRDMYKLSPEMMKPCTGSLNTARKLGCLQAMFKNIAVKS